MNRRNRRQNRFLNRRPNRKRGMGAVLAIGALAVALAFISHLMLQDDLVHPEETGSPMGLPQNTMDNEEEGNNPLQSKDEDPDKLGLPEGHITISELSHPDGSFVFISKKGWFVFLGREWVQIEQNRVPTDINEKYPYPFQFGVDEACLLDK